MPCLMKYRWVKIPRDIMPEGRGILLDYIRAYSAAAITRGTIRYCQYENEVEEGMSEAASASGIFFSEQNG